MDTTIVYQLQHEAPFGMLIVFYIFIAGLSAGLFLVSTLSTVFGIKKYDALVKPASIMALGALVPGALALIVDLGQPGRFITLLFRVNPSSAMTWGSFILLFYGIIALVYTWFAWRNENAKRLKGWGIAGLILAASLGLYTGFLLALAPSRPLWNSALVPILFLVSGFVSGMSLLSVANSFFPRLTGVAGEEVKEALHSLKIGFVVLELALLAAHILILFALDAAGKGVAENLLAGDRFFSFVVVQVLIGMVLPLLLLVFSKGSTAILGISGLLSLVGVFALRFNFVIAGGEMPLTGTLFNTVDTSGAAWMEVTIFLVLSAVLVLLLPPLCKKLFDNQGVFAKKA